MTDSIRDVLTELGYNLKDYGKEYRARPIYRDSDNETVLSIKKDTGRWIDYKHQATGTLEDLIKLTLKHTTIDESKKWLSENFHITEIKKDPKPAVKSQRTLPKETLDNLIEDNSYWNNRGITDETLNIFSGGVMKAGRMKERYIFPIFNFNQDLVGLSGRDLLAGKYNTRPKWKHLGDRNQWTYPLQINFDILNDEKQVILVESIGDLLMLWQSGVRHVIVTFGLDISTTLVNLFLKLDPDKIFISFNNDQEKTGAGNRASKKAEKKLLKYFDISQVSVKLPTKNDFGDMSANEIEEWYEKVC